MAELKREQIEEIGKKHHLKGRRLFLFVEYVIRRGFIRDDYYVREWASRFEQNNEWNASDSIGQGILNDLDKEKGGQ